MRMSADGIEGNHVEMVGSAQITRRACAEGAMRGASAATSISAELPPLADQMYSMATTKRCRSTRYATTNRRAMRFASSSFEPRCVRNHVH